MNYGAPYYPNYAAPAPYQAPYQPQYPLVASGQFRALTAAEQTTADAAAAKAVTDKAAADAAAKTAAPTPLEAAWWQELTFNIPRWALASGAGALGLIAYGWQSGWFGKTNGSTASRTRARASSDFSFARDRGRPKRKRSTSRRKRGRRDDSLMFGPATGGKKSRSRAFY